MTKPVSSGVAVGGRLAILAVGDDTVASTRHRVLAHLPALAAAGFEVTVSGQRPRPASRLLRLPLRLLDELRDLRRAAAADVLMVHRRCYPPGLASRLRSTGRPVAFDVDDALYLPSPAEPQTEAARRRYRLNFDATAAVADLVLCGNEVIASEVPHDRTAILPTAVDVERFRPKAVAPGDGLTAGWVGHSSNLGYLEALAGPLREVARRHPGFRLVVAADRAPRIEGVQVEFRRWSLEREVACFAGVDFGLMPLEDTPWTRAKCAFKLLQYMALGLPAVASPVGTNLEVVEPGRNALLAESDRQWVEGLERLISEPDLRMRLGEAGRRTVVGRYSLASVSTELVAQLQRLRAGSGPSAGLS